MHEVCLLQELSVIIFQNQQTSYHHFPCYFSNIYAQLTHRHAVEVGLLRCFSTPNYQNRVMIFMLHNNYQVTYFIYRLSHQSMYVYSSTTQFTIAMINNFLPCLVTDHEMLPNSISRCLFFQNYLGRKACFLVHPQKKHAIAAYPQLEVYTFLFLCN